MRLVFVAFFCSGAVVGFTPDAVVVHYPNEYNSTRHHGVELIMKHFVHHDNELNGTWPVADQAGQDEGFGGKSLINETAIPTAAFDKEFKSAQSRSKGKPLKAGKKAQMKGEKVSDGTSKKEETSKAKQAKGDTKRKYDKRHGAPKESTVSLSPSPSISRSPDFSRMPSYTTSDVPPPAFVEENKAENIPFGSENTSQAISMIPSFELMDAASKPISETNTTTDETISAGNGDSKSVSREGSNAAIAISMAAMGALTFLLIFVVYLRRHKSAGNKEYGGIWPAGSDCSSRDMDSMLNRDITFQVQKICSNDDLVEEPHIDQQSVGGLDKSFGEIRMNEV